MDTSAAVSLQDFDFAFSIPDYLLTVDGNFTFVLDAKAPDEEVKTGHNVEQVRRAYRRRSLAAHEKRPASIGLVLGKSSQAVRGMAFMGWWE
jgi:hypothetical protein